jgi:flagellar hook assembly protein FlgD
LDIAVYDILGNLVFYLVNKNQSSGSKSVQWDAKNNQGEPVSAGVYLYKIQAGDFSQTKKMIQLK